MTSSSLILLAICCGSAIAAANNNDAMPSHPSLGLGLDFGDAAQCVDACDIGECQEFFVLEKLTDSCTDLEEKNQKIQKGLLNYLAAFKEYKVGTNVGLCCRPTDKAPWKKSAGSVHSLPIFGHTHSETEPMKKKHHAAGRDNKH